jgi:hypothetical protein
MTQPPVTSDTIAAVSPNQAKMEQKEDFGAEKRVESVVESGKLDVEESILAGNTEDLKASAAATVK